MPVITTPIRYPGGKAKALRQLAPYLPASFSHYREALVGGGSLFIQLKQQRPGLTVWINDLNYALFCFWRQAQLDPGRLAAAAEEVRRTRTDGRALHAELTDGALVSANEFEHALRFFVLNRITFSGTVESGGYSQEAFEFRFTRSAVERVARLGPVLTRDMRITHLDYEHVLAAPGEDVFIFLDPPYLSATKSKLYGRKGDLHTSFDHTRFARLVRACRHRWLITYDDTPQVRQNFAGAGINIYKWQLQYSMNNYKRARAAPGKELIITNFDRTDLPAAGAPALSAPLPECYSNP